MGNNKTSSKYNDDSNLDNKENLKLSKISEKIHIDNNWTVATAAGICTGDGTYSEPYVIEDLVIDGGGSGSCILIENSYVFFIIENCTVYNSGGSPDAGITLSNANNGYLTNNNCSNNYNGICLNYSDNNIITGNTANNNYWTGISIRVSNSNYISGNNANYNSRGISIRVSNSNYISGNNANYNSRGICMGVSDYNDISGNTVSNNSWRICMGVSDYNDISGNIANYNSYGIHLSSSDYNNISGNNLIGNDICIVEFYCSGNKFSDNGSCTYGQGDGILLIILISVISGGAVIGVATLLLINRKRKRIE